ncbi:12738_t:CDS:1 [Acaulospora morrowiae]|uniref:12738_t:CDS:1 n=1 Tax=Acaulospora morrowiae TaxID=94023 RepID=A0A9N8Z753_9GLOM|nr:12738_t:CDS:1 [Acaulospora morrowiae]
MNYRISIITLLFILAQIFAIDARHRHVCTVTTAIPKTVTLTTCNKTTPTQTYEVPEYPHFKKYCKTTTTVTISPTVTHCATCCEISGGPGWENTILIGKNTVTYTDDTTPQDCCKSCMADSKCAQWAFVFSECQHNVGTTCQGRRVAHENSGIMRCTGEGCYPKYKS